MNASAPGKMVLAGEYAVLDGHAALVAAVSARATVEVAPAAALTFQGNGPARFSLAAHDVNGRTALPLLWAVADAIRTRPGHHLPAGGHYRVDTAAFSIGGAKIGLGSSAAAAVALTRALLPDVGLDAIYAVARDAHRNFQGGGSGIDVAASTWGGVLSFTEGRAAPAPPLPPHLALIAVFVGHGTPTQGFVDRYRALADRGRHADALAAAAEGVGRACGAQDAGAFIAAIHAARIAMETMGRAAGIDVVSAPHRRVSDIAEQHGGAAKPSGAGGGDVALCAVPEAAQAAVRAALSTAGFTPLALRIGEPGARIDA